MTNPATASQTMPEVALPMPGGVRLVVPDSLDLMTPYILREQGDWFEDEIKLVRRILLAGETAIDVGANYGAYAMSICASVGATGRVWAFEPASHTAAFLRQSVAANRFTNVAVVQAALSDRDGAALLETGPHSELNHLVGEGESLAATERVPLLTLDQCMVQYGWRDVAFLKLDAEGEELRIVNGGMHFLRENSPLVMFELKHGDHLNMDLIERFSALGYRSYCLVTGLDLLAPFDSDEGVDDHLLNLFCCRDDRAALLESRGVLARSGAATDDVQPAQWRAALAGLPYARDLAADWAACAAGPRACDSHGTAFVLEAIGWHFSALDAQRPPAARYEAITRAYDRAVQAIGHGAPQTRVSFLSTALDTQRTPEERYVEITRAYERSAQAIGHGPTQTRFSTLARIADAAGARVVAILALAQLIEQCEQHGHASFDEPFLVANERFDRIEPGASIGAWFLAAALEKFELRRAYSSFYTGDSIVPLSDTWRQLGFASPEIERRRALFEARQRRPRDAAALR